MFHSSDSEIRGSVSFIDNGFVWKMPFWTPSEIPLDENKMKHMFDAFDADHSGSMDRNEVDELLLAAGMDDPTKRDAVLNTVRSPCYPKQNTKTLKLSQMFRGLYEHNGMEWDMFRLWLRRDGFAMRKLSMPARIYRTLDEPGN